MVALPVLTACVSTQEMPLAPNAVRLDTQAQGLLFTGQTVPATMKAAARATLDRGYSHFVFANAGVQQGSVVTGAIGQHQSNQFGSYGQGSFSASSSGFGSTTLVRAPTASASATVLMFHANEPGARNAFDATAVLKQYQ